MTYEKPDAEVILFGEENVFMTTSGNGGGYTAYNPVDAAVSAECNQYSYTNNNKITCGIFGGYNSTTTKIQNGTKVSIAGGLYEFDYRGNHWKLVK